MLGDLLTIVVPVKNEERNLPECLEIAAKFGRYIRAFAYFFLRYVVKRGFLDGRAGFRWHFSALAYARRVRFPTGREPPQGAVTARAVVPLDRGPGDRKPRNTLNTRKMFQLCRTCRACRMALR